MSNLHGRCNSYLKEIEKAFSEALLRAQTDVEQAEATLSATTDAEPRTVEELLDDALAVSRAKRQAAQDHLDEVGRGGWWNKFWNEKGAKEARDSAVDAYQRKLRREQEPSAVEKRTANSEHRALTHKNYIECKGALQTSVKRVGKLERATNILTRVCKPLEDALVRKAWFASKTEGILRTAAERAQKQDFNSAIELLNTIEFQRLPSEDQVAEWVFQYKQELAEIRKQRSGFAATALYPGLTTPSLELAKLRFDSGTWVRSIEVYQDAPDRWYAFPACMVSHGAMVDPVQWLIYWAFLRGSQEFAESSSAANIHEDVLTGMLMQGLRGELGKSSKDRLLQLGYPRAKANFDFLHLAGKKGEFETGADVGLVVLLDVGDLRVHKVALLQAKVSIDGSANIGSKPSGTSKRTQLQKLRDVERDFFVFYHRTDSDSPSPLPTVTSVQQLVKAGGLSTTDLAKETITAKPRMLGWDLPSFIAFGLCTPANALGRDVLDNADPLEAMTAGGRDSLPKYMIVVSLSHDEPGYHRVMEPLRQKGYSSVEQLQNPRKLQPSRTSERGYDGPERD
ncbi:hypothetical protein [Stenotrophomonas maltophilia]|uniref:hypothetical protein n=1 Tax=Stenotrophomonas maltophilia TaxID=40324 RepID=UPI002E7A1F70|nr:hypothetical protein [Stenotrophomonas maltophilia]